MSYYLDASFIIPYYCKEPSSSNVQKIIVNIQKRYISDLTPIEIHSVLAKKIRKKELRKKDAERISAIFNGHVKDGYYEKISLKKIHYKQAEHWVQQFDSNLRTLDALQLSVAAENNLGMATLDKALNNCAAYFGISVLASH